MTTSPTIFAVMAQGQNRPLLSEAIPSLAELTGDAFPIDGRAWPYRMYQTRWMEALATMSDDEQRDFALGFFMARMAKEADEREALQLPPHVGAFVLGCDKHMKPRNRHAYRCGLAFATGRGSKDAAEITIEQ